MCNRPKTIKIFLTEGEPTGIKKVQVSNWSGVGYVIPRNKLKSAKDIEGLNNQCIYFLIGSENQESVYIGEAEDFLNRLKDHNANKDFWNKVVCFMAKDESLNKAHVKFLESIFIEKCIKANRVPLENSNKPSGSKLPHEEKCEMEEFAENCEKILATLGFNFFELVKESDSSDKLYIKNTSFIATGVYGDEGMMVLSGSEISNKTHASLSSSTEKLRQSMPDSSFEKIKGGFKLTKNLSFNSPSQAADFVLGRSANGWTEWRDKDGKTLDEIQERK
jgi:hypothetical protein